MLIAAAPLISYLTHSHALTHSLVLFLLSAPSLRFPFLLAHTHTRLKEHFFSSFFSSFFASPSSAASLLLGRPPVSVFLLRPSSTREVFFLLPVSFRFVCLHTELALAHTLVDCCCCCCVCWSPQFLLLRRQVVHFTEQIFALLIY